MYRLINPKFDFVKKISDIEFTFNCGKSRLLLLSANGIAWFNPAVGTKKNRLKGGFFWWVWLGCASHLFVLLQYSKTACGVDFAPNCGAAPASPVARTQTSSFRWFNLATPDKKKPPQRRFFWWVWLGSNQRPLRCQRSAHTTELHTR